jgi:hypothetical protein
VHKNVARFAFISGTYSMLLNLTGIDREVWQKEYGAPISEPCHNRLRTISILVARLTTSIFLCVALSITVIAAPSEQQPRPPVLLHPERLDSYKSYVDESQQIRDLWSSTMKNSPELQALIQKEYPTLTPEEEEGRRASRVARLR